MPFKSQQQRKFMYSQHPKIANKWEKETPSGKLPKKVKKEEIEGSLGDVFAVQMPFSGCKPQGLVKQFNPVVGLSGSEVVPEQVHAVFPTKEQAESVANQLYEDHCQKELELEAKKEKVTTALKKSMDELEKMRSESMGMIKENPKDAGVHKQKVAHLTGKIDELMNKLEMIEKSKKNLEKKDKSQKKS